MAQTVPPPRTDDEPVVLVVMGVTGTGKSTVAGLLAGLLGWDLEEGDDLHPPANVAKMAAGHALTDADRWPWLAIVGAWVAEHVRTGTPGIITCSSLKRGYRDRLRGPGVVFVHLSGSQATIRARLDGRRGHFMPPALLDSQLATLEPLEADEQGVVVPLGGEPRHEVLRALELLGLSGVEVPPEAEARAVESDLIPPRPAATD